jgi:hypothetical protein
MAEPSVIDDRPTARGRPWFLRHQIDWRDKTSKWSLTRQGKRDGSRSIPHLHPDYDDTQPLTDDQLRSTGTISRIHAVGAARVHDIGMEWHADRARIESKASAIAGEFHSLHMRVKDSQRRLVDFETESPEPKRTEPAISTIAEQGTDTAIGFDPSNARNRAADAAHEAAIARRSAERTQLRDAITAARETIARLPFDYHALELEIQQIHDLCQRDANRHREFAYELMAIYWTANQSARRTWWRRLIWRIRKRQYPPLPVFRTLPIEPETWEAHPEAPVLPELDTSITSTLDNDRAQPLTMESEKAEADDLTPGGIRS